MNAYAYRQVQICIIKYYLLGEIGCAMPVFSCLYMQEKKCVHAIV